MAEITKFHVPARGLQPGSLAVACVLGVSSVVFCILGASSFPEAVEAHAAGWEGPCFSLGP